MSEKKAKVVKPEVQAKFGPSLLVFLLVTAVILVGILVLGLDAHIPIVIAAMIVAVYGIILHVPFKDLEHAMIKTISESVPVLLLICIVGCPPVPYPSSSMSAWSCCVRRSSCRSWR